MTGRVVETRALALRLLGRFDAMLHDVNGESPVHFSQQERALLAFLGMQPGYTETRERLATLFWETGTDRQARQNLRQCLLILRKKVDPVDPRVLKIDRHSVGLDPTRVEVDARRFLEFSESDDGADLERSIALYRGAFLDGFSQDTDTFNAWLGAQRDRLDAIAVRTFERYAALNDKTGNGTAALHAAERLADILPLDEGAHRILLRTLARYRGREAAISHAALFTQRLRQELDTEPDDETLRLADDIRAGAIPVQPIPADAGCVGTEKPIAHAIAGAGATPRDSLPASRQSKNFWAPALFTASVAAVAALAALVLTGSARPILGTLFASRHAPADPWRPPVLPTAPVAAAMLGNSAIYPMLVLPIRSDSSEGSVERRFAEHLTSDLINDLSRAPNARVISSQTSRLFAGKNVDVAQVGAELGVRYVVEGDLSVDGAQMRLNVSLTDAVTRLLIWSDRFEGPDSDRLAVRDEIARAITRRLQINLVTIEDRRRIPNQAKQSDIDDLLAKGWAATTRISTADKTTGADTYFTKVLELDPANVSALTGLGAFHVVGIAMFLADDGRFDLAKAEQALSRAVELNPDASLPHYYLGVLHKTRGHPDAALEAFAKSVELNPSYAPAYAQIGHVLSRIGRLDEALEHVRYAIRLSPKDHNLGLWSLFGGEIELELGHDRAAVEWLSRAADAAPRSPFIQASLAAVYALLDNRELTTRHAAETRRLAPWMTKATMIDRLVGLSKPGSEPHRLISGLNKAFAGGG